MTTDYARWFMVAGSGYLLVGIGLGIYMGGSGNHGLAPLHAHINLVGFALMTVFGLVMRLVPAMAANRLGQAQFWLFQIAAPVFMVVLYLLLTERADPATIGPVIVIAETAIFLAVAAYAVNLFRNT